MKIKQPVLSVAIIIGALLLCTGGGLLVIQLVPVNRSNPPVVQEPDWDSPQTRALMERACLDCHSNETKWPWYSKVAPVSWLVVHDVQEGREKLNYSEWSPNQENEAVEAILEGEMPPGQYLILHPEARLTEAETRDLVNGLKATFGNQIGEVRGAGDKRDDAGRNQKDNDND